ncbi:MAG: glycosyltransferase family 39 protein [Chloroflexi bacterium]|nr:glycosyltransferase family 39 protein [Chloroflexota bacterium]
MKGAPRQLHVALMLAATVALLFSLLIYLLYAANLIAFPYDYDQGEGFELHDTALFSRFQLPYRDTERYPFYASNYPPLFHMMAAPFVWLFGPSYWYGRLLGFLASLVSAAAIAYAVYRDGERQRWIALLAGLAFLSSNFVYHIGPLFRQHTMMVTFETLAVVLLASAFPKRDKRGIAAALGLLICAGYTKQLAAITAASALVWMFLRAPWRATRWSLAFAVGGAAAFLWLNFASGGQWWIQAIVANVNDFIPDQAIGLFILWFKLHGLLLIPAVMLLIYELYFDRLSIYSIWLVFSALLGGLASGTWGAGDSYFVSSIAAVCILSGIFCSRLLTNAPRLPGIAGGALIARFSRVGLIIVPLLYLGYARATLKMPTDGAFEPVAKALGVAANVRENFYDSATFLVGGYARIGYFLTDADWEAGAEIVQLIDDTEGPALSEEAGFAMAAGREVVTNPTQLRNLHLAGLFDGSQLIELIARREFGIVILRAQFYPPPVLAAIGDNYQHALTIHMNGFDYSILYPMELDGGEGTPDDNGLPD